VTILIGVSLFNILFFSFFSTDSFYLSCSSSPPLVLLWLDSLDKDLLAKLGFFCYELGTAGVWIASLSPWLDY